MTGPLSLTNRQTPHVDGRRSAPGRAFAWICGLAGVALTLLGADETRRLLPALGWRTAAGRVENARVSYDTVATRVSKWRNSPVVEPRFHVSYRYRAAGAEYVGHRVALLAPNARDAAAELRRYPPGTTVSVRYDAAHPASAVLEARRPVRAVATASVGLSLLFFAWRLARGTVGFRRRDA